MAHQVNLPIDSLMTCDLRLRRHSENKHEFDIFNRMSDVTRILNQIDQGDATASEQLLPLVYEELRRLAGQKMAAERKDHTLQATALVHEAYVRLVDKSVSQGWNSRGHFFAAAAEAMRRILIEQARRKRGPEAGGDRNRVELSESSLTTGRDQVDLLALNDALEQLEASDPRAANVIKLRFFAGLTVQQTADSLGISVATAKTDWAYAKSWLMAELVAD